jgi:hypothetical protein
VALSAAEALDDPRAMAVALNARAAIDHRFSRHAEAVRGHRRALELTGSTGGRYPEARPATALQRPPRRWRRLAGH